MAKQKSMEKWNPLSDFHFSTENSFPFAFLNQISSLHSYINLFRIGKFYISYSIVKFLLTIMFCLIKYHFTSFLFGKNTEGWIALLRISTCREIQNRDGHS
jgi:hypothetical protein